jgi:putative intracellular protease/amidase
MQIAIVLYPGFTALDFIGPYEVLRWLPKTEVRFVWHEAGPVTADSGVLRFDHPGRRRTANRQARHVALDGAERSESPGRHTNRR